MALARRPSAAEVELLGWRSSWADDRLTVEGPIPGQDEWRVVLVYFPVAERLVLGELRVIPATARRRYATEHREVPAETPLDLTVGYWSGGVEELEAIEGPGITARLLREIKVGELARDVKGLISATSDLVIDEVSGRTVERVWTRVIRDESSRPRSAGRSDEFYAAWAGRYLRALDEHPRAPYVLLAERYGVTVKEAQYLVARARSRCILTAQRQGKAGGQLTAKGERLLRDLAGRASSGRDGR